MTSDFERLARYVTSDRKRRWRSRRAFARAAQVSPGIVDRMENGTPSAYRPASKARIEAELGWTDGSVDRVLSGGDPAHVPDPLLAELTRLWPKLDRGARQMLVSLARGGLHR